MAGDLEFKVSPELIMPIIKEKIQMAIVEALGGHEQMLGGILEAYMGQKVDEKGVISNYSSDNKYKRIDILVHKLLEDAVREALKTYLSTKQETIAKAVAKYFATSKGSIAMVNALQEGIIKGLANGWRTTMKFELVEPQ